MHIRKIGMIGRTYRHIQRYRQILTVLFKYGFGDLVDTLKIEQYLEIGLQMISRKRREKMETLTRAKASRPNGMRYLLLARQVSCLPVLWVSGC